MGLVITGVALGWQVNFGAFRGSFLDPRQALPALNHQKWWWKVPGPLHVV